MRTRTLQWASPIAFALATLTHSAPAGDVVHVPGDFPTIQAGIDDDATEAGDVVLVAPGTYRERIDMRGKAIAVRGSGGAAVTIIDAERLGSVVTCSTGETPDTIIEGFTITGGSAATGGGFFFDDASPTVVRCLVRENTAGHGGGLFGGLGSAPTVSECQFIVNQANLGGGVYAEDAHIVVQSSTFDRNDRHEIFVRRSDVTISDCTFDDAGFYPTVAQEECTLTARDCHFGGDGVFAEGGGALNSAGGTVSLTRCTIEGYHASGIYQVGGSLTLTGGSLVANESFWRGGAIYVEEAELAIDGVLFEGNVAPDEGGSLFAWASDVTVTNSVFINNEAHGVLGGGGALFLSACELDVSECGFISNRANQGWGGAIASDDGVSAIRSCVFRWDVAYGGGAFSCRGEGEATITDSTFDSCAASEGGAIHGADETMIAASRSLFSRNAAYYGGAVRTEDGGVAMYSACHFAKNIAVASGGAIFGKRYDLIITDCAFIENEAGNPAVDGAGGAIYNGRCQPTITDTTFRGNNARGPDGRGGAIMNVRSEGSAQGCVFADNTATGDGGAMEGGPTGPFLTVAGSMICGSEPQDFSGGWVDGGRNEFLEECARSCRGDLDDSGDVDFTDLLGLLFSWGPCDGSCPADLDGSGDVGSVDLWILLAAWGGC